VPPAAAVPSVGPSRVAQTTPLAPAPAPSTPAPAASAQSKPAGATSIPPCDKPGGMSLARIVEIDTTGGPGFATRISIWRSRKSKWASGRRGRPLAPFFRFPDLQHPPQLLEYLAQRNIGIFSTDIDSRDFKIHKPEQVIKSVMGQLEKRGKGIILMHDFQHNTAETLPQLLQQLKAAGYKVVHMVPKGQVTTIPKYDEMVTSQDKLSSNNTRPENSVVRTIGE
jgi:hypothetical protein